MGGTGPGTQQVLHKYLMNERARQRAFPELMPQSVPFGVEARPAGRTIWLLGEPAWGTVWKQRSRIMPAAGQCWATAANAAGLFPALIMAVLINCATAASILLSFN